LTGRPLRRTVRPPEDRRGRASAAPRERPQPGAELSEHDRLDQVIVGAQVEAAHQLVGRVRCRQHQDPRVGAASDEPPTDLVAVHHGKVAIENNDVIGYEARLRQRRRAIVGDVHDQALPAQPASERSRERPFVLNHEHPDHDPPASII